MPEYMISGVPVSFPFEPYDVQVTYMEKVIECLEKRQNGVLESPTGTGKTLSLLCASCGWMMQKKAQLQAKLQPQMFKLQDGDFVAGLQNSLNIQPGANPNSAINEQSFMFKPPKVIYASRTHSQLSQAIQELKRTCYSHIRVAVLGSRDQMCIHPEVSREPSNSMKVIMCRAKVNSKTCHFYNNVERKKDDIANQSGILDIEDLVKVGRKMQCCPYYAARELNANADITFMPYNYLLDPKTRKALGIELLDTVVILDEAHNIEKMCEESASIEFSSTNIAMCIDEITVAMKDFADEAQLSSEFGDDGGLRKEKDFTPDDLCLLKAIFLELEKAVDELTEGSTFPGDYILELLAKAQLTPGKKTIVMEVLTKIIQYLSTTSESPFQRKGTALQKFNDLLSVVFRHDSEGMQYLSKLKQNYKVHISVQEVKKNKRSDSWSVTKPAANGRVVNFWCFSPQFGMEMLLNQGVRCVVLTSGTLAPLKPFISELGIPVAVQLENPHIVGADQVCVAVVKNGPDNCQLNSSFKTRDNPRYMSSLARTILNLSRIIPDGLLIFFPSYHFMRKCQEEWQNDGMWAKISALKPIFVEPQSKDDFTSTMDGYYAQVQDPSTRGACFMAVTRGKVSEGLDFADFNGRAVIITGLPYPPFKDPRVVLKQKYLQEIQAQDKSSLSGMEWYQLEATRAVNQAVGRVIRHAKDYGAVLLCDSRFDNNNIKKQLSAWLQPHIKTYTDFGTLTKNVKEFFRSAEKNLPAPKTKSKILSGDMDRLAPVSAYFDTASKGFRNPDSRSSSSSNAEKDLGPLWSPKDYSVAVEPALSNAPKSVDGLFGALDTSSHTIDFNDTMDSTFVKKTESGSMKSDKEQKCEPVTKRPKLKLAPLNFDPFEVPDYSNVLQNSNKTKRKCELSSSVFTPGTSCSAMPSSSSRSVASSENIEKGRDPAVTLEIAKYLKELKKTLDTESYKKFTVVTSHYNQNKDFDHLIEVLKDIFISKNLHSLFRGFHRFIKREHKEKFKQLCELLGEKT
ncbi:regulator of telomere elongation helicase 1 homolog [Anabrus simplex]|uniref:regulator of telomere elongation helicase 1 homolog n=1 Tax=Anabrus simplex TaxID=316456 RepID=UPI0035A37872